MNTFKSVAEWYDNTQPINEREHGTSRDLRPIGERRRKWERIIKFNDNCYGLADGYEYYRDGMTVTQQKACMPILWQRTRDGYEKVTVRAGFGGQCNGRYEFLFRRLPMGIDFRMNLFGQPKHGVIVNRRTYGGEFTAPVMEYHLPNQSFRPWLMARANDNTTSDSYVNNMRTKDPKQWKALTTDDRKFLTFSRKIGTHDWTLVSKPHLIERTGSRVKKSEKAMFKAALGEFREYCYNIGCMLPQEPRISAAVPYSQRAALMEDYQNHVRLQRNVIAGDDTGQSHYWTADHQWVGLTTDFVRDVIRNPEHEARIALVTNIWRGAGWYNCDWSDESDRKTAMSRYNTYINKIAGFTKPVTRKTEK